MKALVMGPGAPELAGQLWPDAELVSPDWHFFEAPDYLAAEFDRLLAYFVLPRLANLAVLDTLKAWRRLLKPGGQLQLHVPSAEWFARQILDPKRPSPFALQHLFGLQVDPDSFYLSAFTLGRLRKDLDEAGFAVQAAQVLPYRLVVSGQSFLAEQHQLLAVKPPAA